MEVPRLIKLCVMTCFDDAASKVEIDDVLIGSQIAQEDASEVVVIQLCAAFAAPTDADA